MRWPKDIFQQTPLTPAPLTKTFMEESRRPIPQLASSPRKTFTESRRPIPQAASSSGRPVPASSSCTVVIIDDEEVEAPTKQNRPPEPGHPPPGWAPVLKAPAPKARPCTSKARPCMPKASPDTPPPQTQPLTGCTVSPKPSVAPQLLAASSTLPAQSSIDRPAVILVPRAKPTPSAVAGAVSETEAGEDPEAEPLRTHRDFLVSSVCFSTQK